MATAQTTFDAQVSRTQASTADRIEPQLHPYQRQQAEELQGSCHEWIAGAGWSLPKQQFQSINGRTSSSISYKYVVQGSKSGTVTIGSATVEAGGKTYSTNPLR